jgi:hypothetical protein
MAKNVDIDDKPDDPIDPEIEKIINPKLKKLEDEKNAAEARAVKAEKEASSMKGAFATLKKHLDFRDDVPPPPPTPEDTRTSLQKVIAEIRDDLQIF